MLRKRGEKRKNYHGEEIREHGEAAAQRLIEAGLCQERLSRGELAALAKGDPRKARIASKVRAETTVGLQWLARELAMGSASNVAHACRRQTNGK